MYMYMYNDLLLIENMWYNYGFIIVLQLSSNIYVEVIVHVHVHVHVHVLLLHVHLYFSYEAKKCSLLISVLRYMSSCLLCSCIIIE